MTDPAAEPGLSEIRGLIAARDDLTGRMDWATADRLHEFNAAQDRLAARVPALVAALEAALKLADEWKTFAAPGDAQDECADELRAAITGALAGKEPDRG